MSAVAISDFQFGFNRSYGTQMIWLITDAAPGGRGSAEIKPSSVEHFLAYASILNLKRSACYDMARTEIRTWWSDQQPVTNADPSLLTQAYWVKRFEAAWSQEHGGWIVLWLIGREKALYTYQPADAAKFAAFVTTLENGPVFVGDNGQLIRGIPESTLDPTWGQEP